MEQRQQALPADMVAGENVCSQDAHASQGGSTRGESALARLLAAIRRPDHSGGAYGADGATGADGAAVAVWLARCDCACAILTRALLAPSMMASELKERKVRKGMLLEARLKEKIWRAGELVASKLASRALLPPRMGLRRRQRLRLRSSTDALLVTC